MKRLFLLIILCSATPAIAYPENDATFLYSNPHDYSINFNSSTGNTYTRGANETYTNTSTREEFYKTTDSLIETSTGRSFIKLNSGRYLEL